LTVPSFLPQKIGVQGEETTKLPFFRICFPAARRSVYMHIPVLSRNRFVYALCCAGWLAATLLTAMPALAQRTLAYTEPDYHYRNGVELFERNNYAAARYEFQQYLDRQQKLFQNSDENIVSAEYYTALSSLYMDEPGAEVLVDRFVKNHSEHPRAGQLYGELGLYYEAAGDNARAITYLEKAIAQNGTARQQQQYAYRLALAYFNTQDGRKALPLFNDLKTSDDPAIGPASAYYAGVIRFRANDLTGAVADFRRVEQNPTYRNEVPNWIASALYKQRKFDELTAYTEPLLRSRGTGTTGAAALPEVALYTAEVYYQQSQFERAIPYYRQYVTAKGTAVPSSVRFRYGQSLFRTNAYADAIAQLKPVAAGRDTSAQYAAFTLGISYLQTKPANPAFATTAFDQAGRLSFSKAIQEEARFNHAKLQLDQNNGTEAVRELTAFLAQYPDSPFETEASELIGEGYLASNNYPAAIAYIESLKRRSTKIDATYQRITYQQAVNDFNAERYEAAIRNLNKSLSVGGNADASLRQAAQYWKGESLAALDRYDEAVAQYTTVSKGGGPYSVSSLYGLGYAYFDRKDYARALPYFRDFVSRSDAGGESDLTEDAVLRLADCYLAAKQYAEALRYYDRAIARNATDKDYAGYQKGLILSYTGRDAEAKAQFDQLGRQFPTSRFADDALLQTANVDFEKGAYQQAIGSYSKLIGTRPKSLLLPTALLKRAVAYSNLEQYDPAIADYKRILNEFGQSSAAQSALLGLQNALDDANRTEEFGAVLAQYKRANPSAGNVEQVEFENARNLSAGGKYPQAISALLDFLQTYPGSGSGYEARYLLADAYQRVNDPANALRYYALVMADPKTDFRQRAALRAADLEKQQRNYPRAVRNYLTAFDAAEGKTEQVGAMLGLMDTYFVYPKLDSAVFYAREIIGAGSVVPGAPNRAQLILGKVAQAKGDYKTARTELERTITLAKDISGAEANFLIGEGQFRQKQYKEAIATLLKFNDQFGDEFDYWKGRGFLVVADANLALNETAQAKAVLQSIIDNATNAEIIAGAKQKLSTIK
jgi:tetratricopeptide (TPR) repeat protein